MFYLYNSQITINDDYNHLNDYTNSDLICVSNNSQILSIDFDNYQISTSDNNNKKYSADIENICVANGNINNKNILGKVSTPLSSYNFNPNLFVFDDLLIPKNIFQVTNQINQIKSNNSFSHHMPDWKYFIFTNKQREEFIEKFFPERLGLYKYYNNEEKQINLFIYLWIYMYGGIYVSPNYEIMQSLESIFELYDEKDIYFTLDENKYISSDFFISQPFCNFWIDVVNFMEQKKEERYSQILEEISKTTGGALLTELLYHNRYKYEIIPRSIINPYNSCNKSYDGKSYLHPISTDSSIITYLKCKTGSSEELIYITFAIIFLIFLMIILAIITN